jgi:hypothetical protein
MNNVIKLQNDTIIERKDARYIFKLVYPKYIKTFRNETIVREGFNKFAENPPSEFIFSIDKGWLRPSTFFNLVKYIFPSWEGRRYKRVHTQIEWGIKQREYNYKCAYCGRENIKLTKDHVVSIYNGGSDNIDNIVPACQNCNSRKGKRPVEEFLSKKVKCQTM